MAGKHREALREHLHDGDRDAYDASLEAYRAQYPRHAETWCLRDVHRYLAEHPAAAPVLVPPPHDPETLTKRAALACVLTAVERYRGVWYPETRAYARRIAGWPVPEDFVERVDAAAATVAGWDEEERALTARDLGPLFT